MSASRARRRAIRGARSRGITVANRAVAAAALLAVLLGIGSTPSPAADSGPAFDVVKGERFAVILPSNHTTGFQWQLGRPLDGNVVKLVGSEYRAHDNHLAGAAGSERWIFEAAGPGETTIVLHYVRPWEKSALPGRVSAFSVLVR